MTFRKVAVVLITAFLITATLSSATLSDFSPDEIKNKFEPWLWDNIQELETNGASRITSLIIILVEDQSLTSMGMESLKNYTARLLVEHYGAEDVWIGSSLTIIAKVNSTEVKTIAAYDFVKLLGDGENPRYRFFLDVSTEVVRAGYVWRELEYNGSGKVIAIVDSGINETHPSLAGKIVGHKDFTGTGYNDTIDHGTHVAGIAAGTGAGSPMGKFYPGVALGASLLNVKISDTWEFGPENIIKGIDWAVTNGADVINLSFGHANAHCHCSQCAVCQRVKWALSQEVVVVLAAGSMTDPGEGSIACPGCVEEAIAVGAARDYNTWSIQDDDLYPGSCRGPTADGIIKPDVIAPGLGIMSPDNTGGYAPFSETSASTPHVAGVAALLLQAHPTWSPDMVKRAIKETAQLNDQLVWPDPNRNPENDRGKGIVDASRAVSLLGTSIPADEAQSKYEYGYGDYTAYAYLSGWYDLSAGRKEGVDPIENYAIATLNETFILEYNTTNPKFFFTFHDKGYMDTNLGWADFRAIFKLFAPDGSILFMLNSQIHYESGTPSRYFDDYHTIDYSYHGTLIGQQTYTIEYGFSTYAYQAYSDFDWLDRGAQALWLTTIDGAVIGVGNPSFEERLKSVYEPAYWNWSNVDKDWRELRGDVNGDGYGNVKDRVLVRNALGSYPGHPNWNPDCDINGDGVVNVQDYVLVNNDIGKVANRIDDYYSWYTSGNGTYALEQWLCDHDVHALKGQQVTFSFWFKPDGIGNNATAKITYIIENGSETTVNGNWVYATQDWHNAAVTTTLPANTVAIKVIIDFTNDFQAWIDKATIIIS